MKYQYSISLTWHRKDSNSKEDVFEIRPEMINAFAVFSDYENAFMPIAYATLSINKSNADDIIKYVKDAYFDLSIQKVVPKEEGDSNIRITTGYSGKCVYFIDQDINYNKELDYISEENDKNPLNAILEVISIGLMWEACIERNKQTNNETIVNSTMFNTVMKFLQHTPLVVEPFDYNDNIDQLIVPPKDSLIKTISFLNEVKVFYASKYRMFFDPDCTYLLSSSGKGVKKKGEKYLDCLFNVRSITDPLAYEPGMSESSENKCYYMDIHVKDSYYTKDTDTQKVWNEIETILDPGIDNTKPYLDTVNNAIGNVTSLVNQFTSTIKGTVKDIESIPRTLGNYRTEISYNTDELSTILIGNEGSSSSMDDIFINHYHSVYSTTKIKQIMESYKNTYRMAYQESPSTSTQGGSSSSGNNSSGGSGNSGSGASGSWVNTNKLMIPTADYNRIHAALENNISRIKSLNTSIGKSPGEFSNVSGILTGILAQTTNLPGCLNCVSPTNMSNNAGMLGTKVNKLKADTIQQLSEADSFMSIKETQGNGIISTLGDILDLANELSEFFKLANLHVKTTSSEYPDGWAPVPNPYTVHIGRLNNDKTTVPAYINDSTAPIIKNYGINTESEGASYKDLSGRPIPIFNIVGEYKDWCTLSNKIVSDIQSPVKNVQSKVNNLKGIFDNTMTSIQNIGKTAQQSLDKIVGAAKDIENKIKSLNFDLGSLPDLKKDISIVKDISKIAMLGISSFGVELDLGSASGSGKKVVKVSNDNANVVKNIKSELEIKQNRIAVSKQDIDTTVFTLNKRYTIKNYDAHSYANGVFILTKKSDFFTRAGDLFMISTQLEFAKIKDTETKSANNNGSLSKLDMQGEIKNLLYNANSIVSISNQGIKLSDILRHADAIQQSFDKMNKNKYGSSSKKSINIDDLIIH